jgi:two-component system chemotaxis sensor kinase CheA
MSLDLSKYRTVFIEEATEHLSEMSSALLELEKEATNAEAIDLIFRMAHGIKGMAASLEYAPISEVAHRLEDRMAAIREAGAAQAGDEMALLFRGLETLEAMVAVVRETGEPPPVDFPLALGFLAANAALASRGAGEASKKKALIP